MYPDEHQGPDQQLLGQCSPEMKSLAKQVARETVVETFRGLGLDAGQPIEAQKDFAWLRQWRKSSEDIKRKSIITVITIFITGIMGLIWVSLEHVFTKGG